jgi:hypothetical protein
MALHHATNLNGFVKTEIDGKTATLYEHWSGMRYATQVGEASSHAGRVRHIQVKTPRPKLHTCECNVSLSGFPRTMTLLLRHLVSTQHVTLFGCMEYIIVPTKLSKKPHEVYGRNHFEDEDDANDLETIDLGDMD